MKPDKKEKKRGFFHTSFANDLKICNFIPIMTGNFHTHTRFSDGKGEPEEFVQHAINLGFKGLGFSEHAPVNFDNPWSLKLEDAAKYFRIIRNLKKSYQSQIQICTSLEIDYIPGISYSFEMFKHGYQLDYTIGSVHLVRNPINGRLWFIDGGDKNDYAKGLEEAFENDIHFGVSQYYHQQIEMIKKQNPDIIGHCDKIKMHNQGVYFDEHSHAVRTLQGSLIDALRKQGTIVEVNTRGIYKGRCAELYPGEHFIAQCLKEGIPLMLNSDAHAPQELDGEFKETLRWLSSIGATWMTIYRNGKFRRKLTKQLLAGL